MVDVTVRHEDTGYLEEGYRRKVEKYTPLLDRLAKQLNVERGRVLPIVVGTRGSMPAFTIDSLREMNIDDRGSYITIALLALRHPMEIYNTLLDYDAKHTQTSKRRKLELKSGNKWTSTLRSNNYNRYASAGRLNNSSLQMTER